jgi:nicotinamidase-related amidase
MDLQSSMVKDPEDAALVSEVNRVATAARSAGYPVIWVKVVFREGHPEVSARNRVFSGLVGSTTFADGDLGAEIFAGLDVRASDIVVTKKRISAFAGSDLEVILRSQGRTDLVLAGVTTAGAVLSTVCEAADRDYRVTVLSDCCKNHDPEVQRVLLDKVFPMRAEVTTAARWIGQLKPAR